MWKLSIKILVYLQTFFLNSFCFHIPVIQVRLSQLNFWEITAQKLQIESKKGIVSRVALATPLQSIDFPILPSPQQYWSVGLPPYRNFGLFAMVVCNFKINAWYFKTDTNWIRVYLWSIFAMLAKVQFS